MASVGIFELIIHVINSGMFLVKLSYIEPFLPLCNMYEQIYTTQTEQELGGIQLPLLVLVFYSFPC